MIHVCNLKSYANKRSAMCSKLGCHLENTFLNPHSFVKKCKLNLLWFFQCSSAMKLCSDVCCLPTLLNTSSVIQLRPSAKRCDAAVSVKLVNAFAVWLRLRCALSYAKYHQHTRHFHRPKRNSEALQFLWSLNQALHNWLYIHRTHEKNILTGIW